MMKNVLVLTIFLVLFQIVYAQSHSDKYSYFSKRQTQIFLGKDSVQVRKALYDYLLYNHYNTQWVQTDSSIELAITHDSASWVIYSAFYFDSSKKCYAFTNERCDRFGIPHLKKFLADNRYNWHKIDDNKYLSAFEYGELLEVQIDGNCVAYRRTKLNLTIKQYKELKRSKKRK